MHMLLHFILVGFLVVVLRDNVVVCGVCYDEGVGLAALAAGHW
jgi:hypothetical protein